jgi:outer membrane protein assembly factor BamB
MVSGLAVIFVGIKGTVLALDRATGTSQWRTELKGSDFVNVIQQDGDLYAATRGRLYRLDPASGTVLWCNELPGLGPACNGDQAAPAAEKARRDAASAAAASAAST